MDGAPNRDNGTGHQFERVSTKTHSKPNKQGIWENNQLKQAFVNNAMTTTATGSANPDDIYVKGSEDYEFVFDESVHVDYDNGETESATQEENEEDGENTERTVEEEHTLPIFKYKAELIKAVQDHQVLIIVGETGSGKTTQLPQYLMQELGYRVAITQPRRVAATSVATRVAEEMGVELGNEVGYSIRFDDRTSGLNTKLRYMTDGILLREFVRNGVLTDYDCIMIDEAHERTLDTDILLGLIKDRILSPRGALSSSSAKNQTKIIISSATINSVKFSKFFNDAPIFQIPGKNYPVNIHYTLQPEANYLQACITTVFQIHLTKDKHAQSVCNGDILIFLTGQDEIELVRKSILEIVDKLGISNIIVTPIYSSLSQEQQSEIFQKTPDNHRKIVLATNIAETSLTIDGIKYVIDPGFVKVKHYNPLTGMSELVVEQCSRASVNQRAGRAGRTFEGDCFRIFTKDTYEYEMQMLPEPEIQRTNLSSVVLLLLSMGIKNLLDFPLLDKPSIKSISSALDNLYLLGALNSKGEITKLGEIMKVIPCEPNFVKIMMVASLKFGCLNEILKIISMLHETQSLFDDIGNSKSSKSLTLLLNNPEFDSQSVNSDHMLYLKIYESWEQERYSKKWCTANKLQWKTLKRVEKIYLQLKAICVKSKLYELNEKAKSIKSNDQIPLEHKVIKSFITGFPNNIVKLSKNGSYKLQNGSTSDNITVQLHPSCLIMVKSNMQKSLNKPYKIMLYQQLLRTSKEFVKDCIPVYKEEWLHEMCPQLY